ncbi:MAG: DUF2784 domain-containing protein [Cyclobacteriaceae bacterium]
MLYVWLDTIFWWLHVLVIGFNLTGWIWNSTRRIHLILVLLTVFSWLILGFWYGFGYCFLTDWHWEVKRALGQQHLPNSFITYLVNYQLGFSIPIQVIDMSTAITFVSIIIVSGYRNLDLVRKKSQSAGF